MTAIPGASRPDIAAIKLAYPLLEIVERAGVRLKRSGSRRWQGLCPLHEERTPSFFVDVEHQRFMCFGCKGARRCDRFCPATRAPGVCD